MSNCIEFYNTIRLPKSRFDLPRLQTDMAPLFEQKTAPDMNAPFEEQVGWWFLATALHPKSDGSMEWVPWDARSMLTWRDFRQVRMVLGKYLNCSTWTARRSMDICDIDSGDPQVYRYEFRVEHQQ